VGHRPNLSDVIAEADAIIAMRKPAMPRKKPLALVKV